MNQTEKEVWQTVVTYTDHIINGRVAEFLEFVHDDYSGWNNIEPLPTDKQSIINELDSEIPKKHFSNYDIIPIKLNINGDLAVVHYYLTAKREIEEKSKQKKSKHYTDVLIKSGEKWILIADHFGIPESS